MHLMTMLQPADAVVDDMKWFLAFLSLTMIGFGLAFYALYRHDMDNFPDFQNVSCGPLASVCWRRI